METLHKKTIILYITTTVLLIAVIAIALLLFKKMQNRIIEVRNVRERIASIEKYDALYEEEVEKMEAVNQALALIEKEIVTKNTIPLVLSNIELLANDTFVEGEIISAQIVEQKGKAPYVSIEIKAQGTLEDLALFMKKIEQAKNESSIDRFSLTQSLEGEETGTAPGKNIWNLTATLFVLSYK